MNTKDKDTRFGDPFPHVKTVPTGPGLTLITMDTESLQLPGYNIFKYMKPVIENLFENFARGKVQYEGQ